MPNSSEQAAGNGLSKAKMKRTVRIHVIIIDGTLSSLEPGHETNAGLTYRLMTEADGPVSVHYEEGLQWTSFRTLVNVLTGKGINDQIRRAYGYLSSRYRPSDRVFMLGFSRGAYAVRSLAGLIDRIGLIKPEHATSRRLRAAYRHYKGAPDSDAARNFARLFCYDHVDIEMLGVWDTVKSLGINAPVLWRLSVASHSFHNHALGNSIKNGFHALAYNETRVAYSPIMWEDRPDLNGKVEQVWFRGAHADVGGHIGALRASRPLSNIPLVWMLERAEGCGLPLPQDWRGRFPEDAQAPATGTWSGFAGVFIMRKARVIGTRASESLHPSLSRDDSFSPSRRQP